MTSGTYSDGVWGPTHPPFWEFLNLLGFLTNTPLPSKSFWIRPWMIFHKNNGKNENLML